MKKANQPVRLNTMKQQKRYEEQVNKELDSKNQVHGVNERWNKIKKAMNKAATSIDSKIIKKMSWFDDECKAELQKRNEVRLNAIKEIQKNPEKNTQNKGKKQKHY
ncbi:unnamed protein product [Acanthoscelides obtectus]|uniref:Uncharacterized protein n=1 Tax=Acanthoscelides obtectus TaxID=200917 RepID=A0A9P0LSQ1_ACAOB|nr:unnamed protein product [Acanthoscelides obtectus]CAK1638685.1 hypothetical protein AOBTE_LOCUS10759 [Acanthoscelides obtectus]